MLVIKKFTPKKVIITDGEKEYELVAKGSDFDYNILKEILDYSIINNKGDKNESKADTLY